MTERIIRILREEYKDAKKQEKSAYQGLGDIVNRQQEGLATPEDESVRTNLTYRAVRSRGRKEAVGNIINKINKQEGTNYRRDATPRKKGKKPTE
jgi:hypothetical protein